MSSSGFRTLLRELRLAAGLSQEALAERARISVDTVSALERGVNAAPHRDTVSRLADALGIPPAERSRLEASAAQSRSRRISGPTPSGRGLEAAGMPGNLPAPVGELIGRAATIAGLSDLMKAQRLVTLVGSGGIGKTRAALEVGRLVLPRFTDGVWLIDFAPLTDGNLAAGKIAAELGIADAGGRPIQDLLAASLKRRNLLLILDTCEHVIEAAARLAQAILRAAPDVRVIATSREPLRIPGETVFVVPPLSYPGRERQVIAEQARQFGAIALFVERARALDRRFELTDENAQFIAEICRRVEGIALGIELAAAHVRTLNVATLARRLEKILPTLTSGNRTAPAHHQTMRALIDWSYTLLTADERAILQRVAIFADGWTLDAAQAVCSDARFDAECLVQSLSGLVDKSQVVAVHRGITTRYRLLDTVREYALEKLAESGGRAMLAERQAQWAIDFTEKWCDALWNTALEPWMERVTSEVENIHAVLRWALEESDDSLLAARIAGAFTDCWFWTGRGGEAARWFEAILKGIPPHTDDRLVGLLWCGLSRVTFGESRESAGKNAVGLLERTVDRRSLGIAYHNLASGYIQTGKFAEALLELDRALALFASTGAEWSIYYASALGYQAEARMQLAQFDEARVLVVRMIEVLDAIDDDFSAAIGRLFLAELEFASGNARSALTLAQDALHPIDTRRTRAYASLELTARSNLTAYLLMTGGINEAQVFAAEALTRAQSLQFRGMIANAIQNSAAVAALRGDAQLAARLYGYADFVFREAGAVRGPTEHRISELVKRSLAGQLTDDQLETFTLQGSRWSEDDAFRHGFSACDTLNASPRIIEMEESESQADFRHDKLA